MTKEKEMCLVEPGVFTLDQSLSVSHKCLKNELTFILFFPKILYHITYAH